MQKTNTNKQEHWQVLSATMVGRQEKCSNSRSSRMAKTTIFWPWWQPFDSFYFETFSFLPLSPFFLFAMQKSGGGWAWPPRPPGIAGPPLFIASFSLYPFAALSYNTGNSLTLSESCSLSWETFFISISLDLLSYLECKIF